MTVVTEITAPIARIQLNSPNTLNALNLAMGKSIQTTLASIEDNPEIKVVIIESLVEKAFATGIDLKEFHQNNTPKHRKEFLDTWASISRFSKPLIMSLHGYVFGGGLELALMGDILVGADNTLFSQPELSVGTIPGMGATQRLPRRIGISRATDMVLTCRRIDALTAFHWGLISQIVPLDKLNQTITAIALKIAEKSLPMLRSAKVALRKSEEEGLTVGLHHERHLFLDTFRLADQSEGFQAFLEKRLPSFKDR